MRIESDPDGVAVEYEEIEKESPISEDLTRTERLFTIGREPDNSTPERWVVSPLESSTESTGEATHGDV